MQLSLVQLRREAPYIWDEFVVVVVVVVVVLHSNLFHMPWEWVDYLYVCNIYELVWW